MRRIFRLPQRHAVAAPLIAMLWAGSVAPPAHGENRFAGAYLAARNAMAADDFAVAAEYLDLVLTHDSDNPALLENAIAARTGMGDFGEAIPLARRLAEFDERSQIGALVLIVDMLERGAYEEALQTLDAGGGIGPLIDGLLRAWAQLGGGRMSQTLDAFDELAEQPGMEAFGLYHKALALAHVGDDEGAEHILSGEAAGPIQLTRRGVIARAQILGRLGRTEDARSLLAEAFGGESAPEIAKLRETLAAGEATAFDIVTSAQDGMAEAFLDLAMTLRGETDASYPLTFARAAEYLRPNHGEALLLIGELLAGRGQYELANEAYSRIDAGDPLYHLAQIGRADALYRAERPEEARVILEELAATHPQIVEAHVALGDLLRRESDFEAASAAYDNAIALIGEPQQGHWSVYYTRGITREREGRWDGAEADFRQALELSPDQPSVLNYLGYSLVEQHENLDEALDMIERAVAGEPESGYITDSLGWALYRLGRYEEAVEHMERAVELLPRDPIINDHLGDVYWMVGRRLEARFQWQRALSFGPADDLDMDRIRRKLEDGFDKVLEEEGEADVPPAAGHDG